MHYALRCLLLATAMNLAASPGLAGAQPHEVRNTWPCATLGGHTRFTSWGFNIYDASLWVQAGFKAAEYERHAFALELTYLRDFTDQASTSRSIDEMRRLPGAPRHNWRFTSAATKLRQGRTVVRSTWGVVALADERSTTVSL